MVKAWFMAPKEYSTNGKGNIAPMEYTLMVYSPNGKSMVHHGNMVHQGSSW